MAQQPKDRWASMIVMPLGGLVLLAMTVRDGSWTLGAFFLCLFGLLAWWSWPARRGSHVAHAAAQAEAGPDHLIVYWRPG